MSRVVTKRGHRPHRAPAVVAAAVLALIALGQPVVAQERPAVEACGDDRTSACQLPAWTDGEQAAIPSVFGSIEGIAWLEDAAGDAPEGGLDILGAGIGRVRIDDPQAVRDAAGIRRLGKLKKAVTGGASYVVRIVLDRPPSEVPGGHASVHLATDIDGSRSDNVPTSVGSPNFPFAGSQDVYSLTWARTTDKTRLLDSDLSKAWYKDKDPFATSWAAPGVLDMLIKSRGLGEGFRVVTHAAGSKGGYDTLTFGPVAIPTDGSVEMVPSCTEGSILVEPFVVPRLVENGQVVRDVEARASWRGGAVLPIDADAHQALASLIDEADEDGSDRDGRITVPAWVNLFEDGIVIRQRAHVELALRDGDEAYLATQLGLTRRGYDVLRDIEPGETGDAALDAWLDDATDALKEAMPPWRLQKRSGLLVGEAIGACIPWLEPPSEPQDGTEPPADAAAGNA